MRCRRQYRRLLLLLLLASVLAGTGRAQETVRVIPRLEPTKILIGEQTALTIRIVAPKEQEVRLDLPADTLVTGVEILGVAAADTSMVSDRLREIVYRVTLTSFDSAAYTLSPIRALVAGRPVEADDAPILLVNTVPVDLDHPDAIKDIKAQWQAEFVLWDYLVYLAIFYAILTFAGLLFISLSLLLHKRKAGPESKEVPPEPLRDPYSEAVEELQKLKEEKLWENRQVKEYYTEMTAILRRYLKRVYGFDTKEKTSSEILDLFRSHIGRERMYDDLRRILTTADLAKFAKYSPEAGENVGLLSAARAFVEEHKPQTPDDKQESKP